MNVLSLFDGKSSGYTAMELAGIPVTNYYSAEVDKYAIQVSNAIHPNQVRLGDVTKWREWDIDWASIDLMFGGFPCQAWSMAGKQLGDKDERGMLFWVMLDIFKEVRKHNPKAEFLIENVKMKREFEQYITHHTELALGEVHKTLINSALVSAQNRNRYYWTSFPVNQPGDRGLYWGDVREWNVDDNFYYSEKAFSWICRHAKRTGKSLTLYTNHEKMQMLEASHFKNYSGQRFFGILDHKGVRYITPRECFRLQTVPEHYIDKILNYGKIYSHSQNFYNRLAALKAKGNKCKSVKSMTVNSQSQVEKLNCAISTTLGSLGMELQKQLGNLSIKACHVPKSGVSVTARLRKDSALSTIRHGSEKTISQQENVRFVLKTSEVDGVECVLGTLNQSKNMEIQIRLILTPEENSSLMGVKASNISKTQTVDGLIELLRKRLLEGSCEKARQYITLMAINLITAKSIFLFANLEHNTYLCIDSLSQLQCNLLEMGIFTLKMENIKPTSNSALYKIAGNGWTDEVIAHILRGMIAQNPQ